ncbi:hypothetical protein SLA2020_186530 [Shorea laevis]
MTSNVTKAPLGMENLAVMRPEHIEVSMLVMAFAAFVLFVSGSSRRRGYCGAIIFIQWFSYILVSSHLLTFTIGQMQGATFRNELLPLWGGFVLIVFGQVDSFSAYSPEDNEQWKRRKIAALKMAARSSLAEKTKLISAFMASEHRISIVGELDQIEMNGYNYLVTGDRVEMFKVARPQCQMQLNVARDEVVTLQKPFSESSLDKTWKLVRNGLLKKEGDCERALRVIEVELCFLFDLFYTKYAVIFKGGQGFPKCKILNTLFLVGFGVFLTLRFLIQYKPSPHGFNLITTGGVNLDKRVTGILIVGILFMAIARFLFLIASDWAMVLLICNYVRGIYDGPSIVTFSDLNSDFVVATWLSDYCAYFVAFAPRLISDSATKSEFIFDEVLKDARDILKGCQSDRDKYEKIMNELAGQETIIHEAPSGDPRAHVEHLAEGGEFVTHLWALLSHANILNNGLTFLNA